MVPHTMRTCFGELDSLDQEKREGTARQLASLWSAFAQEFGVSRFLEASPSEQQSYLDRLDRIVKRGNELKDTELAKYYYSTGILRHFLEALRSRDSSPEAKAVAKRLALLIEEGRALEAVTSRTVNLRQPSASGPPKAVPIRPEDRR